MAVVISGSDGITLPPGRGSKNPTWASGARPGAPVTGERGFNTALGQNESWNGSAWVPDRWVSLASGVSLTGSAYTLTGIASWVNEILITIVSASGAADGVLGCQVGPSSGYVTTGYEHAAWGSGGSNTIGTTRYTAGFYFTNAQVAANVVQATLSIKRHSGNIWRADGSGQVEGAATVFGSSGRINLSGALDRLRLNFSTGTTFDGSGTVSVSVRA